MSKNQLDDVDDSWSFLTLLGIFLLITAIVAGLYLMWTRVATPMIKESCMPKNMGTFNLTVEAEDKEEPEASMTHVASMTLDTPLHEVASMIRTTIGPQSVFGVRKDYSQLHVYIPRPDMDWHANGLSDGKRAAVTVYAMPEPSLICRLFA